MDVTQLILDDHAEQRRLFAIIEQIEANDHEALRAVWSRLRGLLDTHARAEEVFFYPELLKLGRGADGETPKGETKDAIKDHNEIRDTAADPEDAAAQLIEAFDVLLPAVTNLVANHFRRVLLEAAEQRLEHA